MPRRLPHRSRDHAVAVADSEPPWDRFDSADERPAARWRHRAAAVAEQLADARQFLPAGTRFGIGLPGRSRASQQCQLVLELLPSLRIETRFILPGLSEPLQSRLAILGFESPNSSLEKLLAVFGRSRLSCITSGHDSGSILLRIIHAALDREIVSSLIGGLASRGAS
jgi:hypothetical protein